MTTSETRYAKSGGIHIAYQVVGEGPLDLVLIPGWVFHVELAWEEPTIARFFRRLASFSRLIIFDKRGTGMSDPVPLTQISTIEERMDDLRAVMDAAGSERAALFGVSEGGPIGPGRSVAQGHPGRVAPLRRASIGWSSISGRPLASRSRIGVCRPIHRDDRAGSRVFPLDRS
jgi:pimeloyl-ACP methyl ester carboxylesterase